MGSFVACVVAVAYGAYATHLFAFLGEDPTRYWGPAPLEAWLLAGSLYVLGVAICRAYAPAALKTLLAFDRHAIAQEPPAGRACTGTPLLRAVGRVGRKMPSA